ncbi:Rqc2 family fibronectin-binding protein [Deinococcus roseus]|nr:NFACT family protein [Deinococcus roseus]
MEGLFISHLLRGIQTRTPLNTRGWVFPSETSAALYLEGLGFLVLDYVPPTPALYVSAEKLQGDPHNPFQRFLAAKVQGDLLKAEQLKLDRVVVLHFAGARGFIDAPPTRLLFEVTGRNANLMVLEAGAGFVGRILMAAREITGSRNRYRVVRSGGEYTPPPPYEKLDPRTLQLEDLQVLQDRPLVKARDVLDGMGPTLLAELSRRSGVGLSDVVGDHLPEVFAAVKSLVVDPSVASGSLSEQAREASQAEQADALRKTLRDVLQKRLRVLAMQLQDVQHAEAGTETAQQERSWADLLMAYQQQVPEGASQVELPDFYSGEQVTVPLKPDAKVWQNADRLYARARKREEVYLKLLEREPQLLQEQEQLQATLEVVQQAELPELKQLEQGIVGQEQTKNAVQVGARYRIGGYEVLVGRNSTENELLTHRIGKSMDHWFHAQGYPGSHVLVRSAGKELPFEVVLKVAALAAHYSKARASGNVPVDYTRIKHVWRPRGAGKGQVHYTQQKTVFVDPALPEADV